MSTKTFMNFSILNDTESKNKRSSSPKGYLESDVDLLLSLQILKKGKKGISANNNLVNKPVEIYDFLTWASGEKKIPLPPLARRILCLKRSLIKNSIASVIPNKQQRTGEKQQLEEIEALLKADGAKNLDDPLKCATEGSRWISLKYGSGDTITKEGPGCQTTVNCGADSTLVGLITDIKSKLSEISSTSGSIDLTPLTTKVETIVAELNAATKKDTEAILDKLNLLTEKVQALEPSITTAVNDARDVASIASSSNSELSVISERLVSLENTIKKIPAIPGPAASELSRNVIVARAQIPELTPKIDEILRLVKGKTATETGKETRTKTGTETSTETGTETRTETEREAEIGVETNTNIVSAIDEVKGLVMSLATPNEISRGIENIQQLLTNHEENNGEIQELLNTILNGVHVLTSDETHTELMSKLSEIKNSLTESTGYVRDFPEQIGRISVDILTNLNPKLNRIQDMIADLLVDIQTKTNRIDTRLEEFKSESEQRNTTTHQKLDSIAQRLTALAASEDRFREVLERILTTNQEISELRQLVERIRCPDVNTQPIIQALQAYMDTLRIQIDTLRSNNADSTHISQIQALETRINELQRQIIDCDSKNTRILEINNELEGLRSQVHNLQSRHNVEYGKVQNLTAAAARKQAELDAKNARIAELEESLLKLKNDDEELLEEAGKHIERLDFEHTELHKRILKYESKVHELNERANQNINTISQLNKRLRECEQSRHALQSAKSSLEEEKARNSSRNTAEIARLRKELENLVTANRETLDTVTKDYEKRIKELQEEMEREIAESAAAIQQAQTNGNENAESQRLKCIESVQPHLKRIAELEAEQRTKTTELTLLRSDFETQKRKLITENKADKLKLKDYEAAKERLETQVHDYEAAKERLEQQLQDSVDEKVRLEQRVHDYEAAKERQEQQLQDSVDDKVRLEQRVNDCEAAKARLEKQLQDSVDDKVRLEQRVHDCEAAKERLEQQLKDTIDMKVRLEQRLQDSVDGQLSLTENIQKLQEDCKKEKVLMESTIKSIKEDKENAIRLSDEARRSTEIESQRKIEQLQAELAACKTTKENVIVPQIDGLDLTEEEKVFRPQLIPTGKRTEIEKAFLKLVQYSNRGQSTEPGIEDRAGTLLAWGGAYNMHNEKTMGELLNKFYKSNTGNEVHKRLGLPGGKLPSIQMENIIDFLSNLPEDIQTYKSGFKVGGFGKRTMKQKKKSNRYSRKE
jgi:chromosome segregation ATPase